MLKILPSPPGLFRLPEGARPAPAQAGDRPPAKRAEGGRALLCVGFLSADTAYVDKLIRYLGQRHGGELRALGFTSRAGLESYLADHRLDALLAEGAALGPGPLPASCPVALLAERDDGAAGAGLPAVCKYQRAEQIYQAALALCAAAPAGAAGPAAERPPVLTFLGAAGGVGTTTLAAACARRLAGEGLRTLYLNLEVFPDYDDLFSGPGEATLSEVFRAAREDRQRLQAALERAGRRDGCGVWFYAPFRDPLEPRALRGEEVRTLLFGLLTGGRFDVVVADADPRPSETLSALLAESRRVAVVTDGGEGAGRKLGRLLALCRRLDEIRPDPPLLPRLRVLRNKAGGGEEGPALREVETVGTFPRLEGEDRSGIARRLAEQACLSRLLREGE